MESDRDSNCDEDLASVKVEGNKENWMGRVLNFSAALKKPQP